MLDRLLAQGNRKLIVLGPAMLVAELAGVVALFTGDLPADNFESYMIKVLAWGGGIFAGANILEHMTKIQRRDQ